MSYLDERSDIVKSAPTYPEHDYSGTGEIVTVRFGDEVVGYLSRKGESSLGWKARRDVSAGANIVRRLIEQVLLAYASEGRPMTITWQTLLDSTHHDPPLMARLDGLQSD